MNTTWFHKVFGIAVVALALTLSSCGGGSGTTAGKGGSGIGGTGVTLVRGNVATVVAALQHDNPNHIRALVRILDLASPQAIAAQSVKGISVSGGGRGDVTDDNGRFELIGVTPSSNFVLTMKLSGGKQIKLPIGPVQKSQSVQVNNIVIDARNDDASFSSVEKEDISASGLDDGSSDDNDSTESDSDDDDSSDENDSPDDDDDSDDE